LLSVFRSLQNLASPEEARLAWRTPW
jgi:hypothetical protein